MERLVYLDSDTLFLEVCRGRCHAAPQFTLIVTQDFEHLWKFFDDFNDTTLVMTSAEGEAGYGWYDRFARHPYYGTVRWPRCASVSDAG